MSDNGGPRGEYERRLSSRSSRIAALERTHLAVSNLRLLTAAATAVALWLAFVQASIAPGWVVLPLVAFVLLVAHHGRVLGRLDRARRARRWYQTAIDRLDGRWIGAAPNGHDGSDFARGHPYARDLDLFGRGSLFELVNAARTDAGEATLAAWLRARAGPAEAMARQAAVAELRPMLDCRENLAVVAAEAHVGRTSDLGIWATKRSAQLGPGAGWLFGGCAAVTVALVAVFLARPASVDLLLAWFVLEYAVAFFARARVETALSGVEAAERDLTLLAAVLALIEAEQFDAPRLRALRASVADGRPPAALAIAGLRRLLSILDSTRNMLLAWLAYPLMIRSLVAVGVDRWRARHGAAIIAWIDAVGEFEALASLAGYAYERPADPFPEFVDRGPLFDATALAHPLIAEGTAVSNDVRLAGGAALEAARTGPGSAPGYSRALIVSGSNMSGKSTLLRAVGLNVVLAQAGAPVRAASLRLSHLELGATIRIEDSLQAGQSRFYAEILRIRDIVQAVRSGAPLLFLLDEILHGTNSYDRRIGAEAIVRALVGAGAIGLVTTHDLALTELAARLDGLANVHFEDRIEEGRMRFDYRMRPGVVERSNALQLMRTVGLDV